MEDEQIIQLYFNRSETAITETNIKYGKYCYSIAYNILYSQTDAEECVNDTYFNIWNSIPPEKPACFKAYIGRIIRNLALNRYQYNNAQKRSPNFEEIAQELNEGVSDKKFAVDEEYILKELLNNFFKKLSKKQRIIFLQRYWYFCPLKEIALNLGMKESNVKVILFRVREQFKNYLKQEGVLK